MPFKVGDLDPHILEKAARVPRVAVGGDRPQGPARPGPADEDGQMRLHGLWLDKRISKRVVAPFVTEALAGKQPPDQLYGFIEPPDPLGEAISEGDPVGQMLAFEPARAYAQDGPSRADVIERRHQLGSVA